MDTSPTTPNLNLPIAKSPEPSQRSREIAEASRKFEALLLRQFVEEAFKPMFGQAMGGGPGGEVYQYFMTDALAKSLSQTDSFGFSNLVQLQLTGSGDTSSPASPTGSPSHHGT